MCPISAKIYLYLSGDKYEGVHTKSLTVSAEQGRTVICLAQMKEDGHRQVCSQIGRAYGSAEHQFRQDIRGHFLSRLAFVLESADLSSNPCSS
jgi:sugar/nucleoside kinase (ribokinase family)